MSERSVPVPADILEAIKTKLDLYHTADKRPGEYVGGAHIHALKEAIDKALAAAPSPSPAEPSITEVLRFMKMIEDEYRRNLRAMDRKANPSGHASLLHSAITLSDIADAIKRNDFGEMPRSPVSPSPAVGQRESAEAVAWRVKDFADGWILFFDENHARAEAVGCGNFVEALGAEQAAQQLVFNSKAAASTATVLRDAIASALTSSRQAGWDAGIEAAVERCALYLEATTATKYLASELRCAICSLKARGS